jgi:hypothetical protein
MGEHHHRMAFTHFATFIITGSVHVLRLPNSLFLYSMRTSLSVIICNAIGKLLPDQRLAHILVATLLTE